MKRRTAIGRIVVTGIGATLAFGGFKWYEWNKAPDMAWLEANRPLLAALADTIIPPTDSPGARSAGAPDFILVLLRDCTDRRTLNKFINGLRDLEAHCLSTYHQSFVQCSEADRMATLARSEERDRPFSRLWARAEDRFLGKPFFTTLKEYTVVAYCTSEQGATHGLAYVPVPVHYNGCIPWKPGQPAWATK